MVGGLKVKEWVKISAPAVSMQHSMSIVKNAFFIKVRIDWALAKLKYYLIYAKEIRLKFTGMVCF